MCISTEQIENNKQRFLELLEPAVLSRPNNRWDELKDKLLSSDFMYAPASTKYHANYAGGLCAHSLTVYDNIMLLHKMKYNDAALQISDDTLTIISLLHDISKMDIYTITAKNKKVYSDTGSKYDELGRFDWVSEKGYTIKPDNERFIYGNHEETSEFIIRQYVPLKYEESAAILCHHAGLGFDSCQGGVASRVLSTNKLAALLHIADFTATFIDRC